jgi:hypothetical protein
MATVAFPATGEAEAGTEEEIWGDKDVGEIGVPVTGIADGRTDGTAVGLVVGLPIVVPVEKIVGEGTELPWPPCPIERLSDILNISNPSRSRRKLKGVWDSETISTLGKLLDQVFNLLGGMIIQQKPKFFGEWSIFRGAVSNTQNLHSSDYSGKSQQQHEKLHIFFSLIACV